MVSKILTFIIFSISMSFFAQTEKDILYLKNQTNTKALLNLKLTFDIDTKIKNEKITFFLKNNLNFKKRFYKNNTLYEIIDIINNKPIYNTTDNVNAAVSTRTNHLQVGGSLGLNLEGENINVGVWDGGTVLNTHQEFNENSNSRIILGNTFVASDAHATHVAGTIAANGTNANAKGMAPKAIIKSYDWNNDNSEIITEIINNALLLSNHSYGVPLNSAPTWMMGCYNDAARDWDLIAFNAEYYLSVLSAGNDGSNNYTGGLLSGYDKLTGNKNSKNSLVVANANPFLNNTTGALINLILNSSSSQGPSDDGRVKPDITADGTNTFSPIDTNNQSYTTLTGTSMASPNTTGTLVLLQEYYNELNMQYMKASTLKGLLIHTAEKGVLLPSGPSPKFGWGIINAKDAANLITSENIGIAKIKEKNLINNDIYTFNFNSTGGGNIVATICWTDPAGISQNGQLNSSIPALVNDLDLRITNDTDTFYPWKLQLSDIAGNAIKGDNVVDNVEKIEINNPIAGNYTLTVSHKGTLTNGMQNYSLIINGQNLSLDINDINISDYSISPNPTNGIINFKIKNNNQNVSLNLFDQLGKKVFSTKFHNNSVYIDKEFNFSFLKNGMYYLKIHTNNNYKTIKIIIKK